MSLGRRSNTKVYAIYVLYINILAILICILPMYYFYALIQYNLNFQNLLNYMIITIYRRIKNRIKSQTTSTTRIQIIL